MVTRVPGSLLDRVDEVLDTARDPVRLFVNGVEVPCADAMTRYARELGADTVRIDLDGPVPPKVHAQRRAMWQARVLERLAHPTAVDRAEAAALTQWMAATRGQVLPLPTGPRPSLKTR